MAKKNPFPIDTDPFGSYTGVVRFPDKINPDADTVDFRFPDAMNPVQDVDDL